MNDLYERRVSHERGSGTADDAREDAYSFYDNLGQGSSNGRLTEESNLRGNQSPALMSPHPSFTHSAWQSPRQASFGHSNQAGQSMEEQEDPRGEMRYEHEHKEDRRMHEEPKEYDYQRQHRNRNQHHQPDYEHRHPQPTSHRANRSTGHNDVSWLDPSLDSRHSYNDSPHKQHQSTSYPSSEQSHRLPSPPISTFDRSNYTDSFPPSRRTSLGGFWKDRSRPEEKRPRFSHEKDIEQLQQNLAELVHHLKSFATSPALPNPPAPPEHIAHRITRLSQNVHTSLLSIAPISHPIVPCPEPQSLKVQSTAEKEMEVIRKRRDALIAKANLAKANASPKHQVEPWSIPLAEDYNGGLNMAPYEPSYDMYDTEGLIGASTSWAADSGSGGRCHGCGIGVTVGWRTGPDGPKSLCESCGNHYARMARRTNTSSPSGHIETPSIELPRQPFRLPAG